MAKNSPEDMVKKLMKRAENGNHDDQYRLSNCYYWGYGVKHDTTKAKYWAEQAKMGGIYLSTNHLKEIKKQRNDAASFVIMKYVESGTIINAGNRDSLYRDSIYNLYNRLIREDDHSVIADFALDINISEINPSDKKAGPIIDYLIKRANDYCLPYTLYRLANNYEEIFRYWDSTYIDDDDKLTKKGKKLINTISQLYLQSKSYINLYDVYKNLYDFYKEVAAMIDNEAEYERKAQKVSRQFIKENPSYGYLHAGINKLEEKKYAEGIELLKQSELYGNTCATGHLGVFTLFGIGTASNPDVAVEKMQKAVGKMPMLNDYLGYCHYSGIGTPKNVSLAFECWSKTNFYNPFSAKTFCPFKLSIKDTTIKPGQSITLPILNSTNADISAIAKDLDMDTLHHFVRICIRENKGEKTITFSNEGVIRDSIQTRDSQDNSHPCVGMFETKHTTYLVYGSKAMNYFEVTGQKEITFANKELWWCDGVGYRHGLINNNRVQIFDKYYGSAVCVGIDVISNEKIVQMDYTPFNFDENSIKKQ